FVLQTAQQLEILKESCKVVYVDPDRRELVSQADTIPPHSRSSSRPTTVGDSSRTGKFRWSERVSVENEYRSAAGSYANANTVVRECVAALRSGKILPAERLHEAVTGITESVLRNADAMLLFSQLQEKGD